MRKRADVVDDAGLGLECTMMHDAADELDALRKRCEQLERLVCSPLEVIPENGNEEKWGVFDNDFNWYIDDKRYYTREFSIDAAIKHMEARE